MEPSIILSLITSTKLSFDFDKDGKAGGSTRTTYTGDEQETGANAGVAGFGGSHN